MLHVKYCLLAYLLNFNDDLHRLLEHQYEPTTDRYLYRACWFLSLPSLGDTVLF